MSKIYRTIFQFKIVTILIKGSNFSINKKVGQVFKVDVNSKYQQMLFKIDNLTEDTIYRLRVGKYLFRHFNACLFSKQIESF